MRDAEHTAISADGAFRARGSRFGSCLVALVLVLSPAAGCDRDPLPEDASVRDGAPGDAAPDGAPWADAGADAALADATLSDAGPDGGDDAVPLAGFGTISGECGVLDDTEWNDASPFLFRNVLDFQSLVFDANALSPGGQQIWTDGNLGGSSIHSEIFSFEMLHRCELATLQKTEGFIDYQDAGGKKTDILVTIDARKVGVSVTRAYHYPPANPYTLVEAETLLTEKLGDVLLSAENAEPWDAWERSILHVIAYDAQYADTIETAFYGLDPSVTADTILMVTVTDGDDAFVY